MEIRVIVDRVENEMAVLQFSDGTSSVWPKNKLPTDVKEGDEIKITLSFPAQADH